MTDYEKAEAAYVAADEACQKAGETVPPATPEQERFWARAKKRLVQGTSGDEERERRILREKDEHFFRRQGGRELFAAREAAKVAMNAAYNLAEKAFQDDRVVCPGCGKAENWYPKTGMSPGFCRDCWYRD